MNRENVLDTTYEDDGKETEECGKMDDIGNVYAEWSKSRITDNRRVDENRPIAEDSMISAGSEKAGLDREDTENSEDRCDVEGDKMIYQVDYRGQLKMFEQKNEENVAFKESNIKVEATMKTGTKSGSPINLCVAK